jgi:hypothetical protein
MVKSYMMPSPAPTPPPTKASYAEAYRLMRDGILLLIIAALLIGVGTTILAFTLFSALFALRFGALMETAVAIIVVLIIGAIIALIGLWGKFIPGVERLASLNPEFSTAKTLIKIGLFWGVILLIIGVVTLIILIGLIIVIIAFILISVGDIGLAILAFKLYNLEQDSLYLAIGILFLLIAVMLFISGTAWFLGWLLLYFALGDSIRRVTGATPTAPAMYPPPPPP